MTAESDAALLQQRRLVDKLPREELEDRWSFFNSLTLHIDKHIIRKMKVVTLNYPYIQTTGRPLLYQDIKF